MQDTWAPEKVLALFYFFSGVALTTDIHPRDWTDLDSEISPDPV